MGQRGAAEGRSQSRSPKARRQLSCAEWRLLPPLSCRGAEARAPGLRRFCRRTRGPLADAVYGDCLRGPSLKRKVLVGLSTCSRTLPCLLTPFLVLFCLSPEESKNDPKSDCGTQTVCPFVLAKGGPQAHSVSLGFRQMVSWDVPFAVMVVAGSRGPFLVPQDPSSCPVQGRLEGSLWEGGQHTPASQGYMWAGGAGPGASGLLRGRTMGTMPAGANQVSKP